MEILDEATWLEKTWWLLCNRTVQDILRVMWFSLQAGSMDADAKGFLYSPNEHLQNTYLTKSPESNPAIKAYSVSYTAYHILILLILRIHPLDDSIIL